MEVYIKELICSSILGLKLQKFGKRSSRLSCYRNSSKVLCSLEKKGKNWKKESILSKISLALNVSLTSQKFGTDKKDCLCQKLPKHLQSFTAYFATFVTVRTKQSPELEEKAEKIHWHHTQVVIIPTLYSYVASDKFLMWKGQFLHARTFFWGETHF